eukprot:jgi/Astpho2/6551/Aster-x0734
MSQFYSDKELGVAYSWISAAQSISSVLGSPIAALLLWMDGLFGLRGWQILFLAEGLPTVLCGVYLKLTLAESPATAKCLSPEEQQWLSAQKSHQEGEREQVQKWWHCLRDTRTWVICFLALGERTVKWAIVYWTPLTIARILESHSKLGDEQSSGASAALVTLLSMVPFATGAGLLSYIASIMEGPAAATCIATVNSVGNLGGLIGPFMIDYGYRTEAVM